MRQAQIFSGSSHPLLAERICDRLGQKPGQVELKKFSNGETSVQIQTSIRNQDVFIVQSGSSKMNDSLMELLIMVSACKGGSARSITGTQPEQIGMKSAKPWYTSCYAVLPILSPVQEEVTSRRHHRKNGCQPSRRGWR